MSSSKSPNPEEVERLGREIAENVTIECVLEENRKLQAENHVLLGRVSNLGRLEK